MKRSNSLAETMAILDQAMKAAGQEEIETSTSVPDAGVNDGSADANEQAHAKDNSQEVSDQVGPGSAEDDVGSANKEIPEQSNVGASDAEDKPEDMNVSTEPNTIGGEAATAAATSDKTAEAFIKAADELAAQLSEIIGKQADETETESEDSDKTDNDDSDEAGKETTDNEDEDKKEDEDDALKQANELFEKYPHIVAQGYAAADSAIGIKLAADQSTMEMVESIVKMAQQDVDELFVPAINAQLTAKTAVENPDMLDPQLAAIIGAAENAPEEEGEEGGAEDIAATSDEGDEETEEEPVEIDSDALVQAIIEALAEQGVDLDDLKEVAKLEAQKNAKVNVEKAAFLKEITTAVNNAIDNIASAK